jgi:hypothetical protein
VTWALCRPLLNLNKLFLNLNIKGIRMKRIIGKEVGGEKTRKVYDKLGKKDKRIR